MSSTDVSIIGHRGHGWWGKRELLSTGRTHWLYRPDLEIEVWRINRRPIDASPSPRGARSRLSAL